MQKLSPSEKSYKGSSHQEDTGQDPINQKDSAKSPSPALPWQAFTVKKQGDSSQQFDLYKTKAENIKVVLSTNPKVWNQWVEGATIPNQTLKVSYHSDSYKVSRKIHAKTPTIRQKQAKTPAAKKTPPINPALMKTPAMTSLPYQESKWLQP